MAVILTNALELAQNWQGCQQQLPGWCGVTAAAAKTAAATAACHAGQGRRLCWWWCWPFMARYGTYLSMLIITPIAITTTPSTLPPPHGGSTMRCTCLRVLPPPYPRTPHSAAPSVPVLTIHWAEPSAVYIISMFVDGVPEEPSAANITPPAWPPMTPHHFCPFCLHCRGCQVSWSAGSMGSQQPACLCCLSWPWADRQSPLTSRPGSASTAVS